MVNRGLLDPKVDFVFKNIFGSPKHPRILISFLNAILKPAKKIVSVEIKGTDIGKQFLKNPESEKVRDLEMNIEEIRAAKDELVRMSNDSEQRQIYEMRANTLRDKISALNKAKEEGKKEEKVAIAKNLLDVLDNATIALKTGLTEEEVKELR